MFPSHKSLLLTGLSAALLLTFAENSGAQPQPREYPEVLQRLRDAQKKIAVDSRDIYPLLEIIQGAEYPKAIHEAAVQGNDTALLELYQAKYGAQWPRTVEGTPVLTFAAMNGDGEVVRRLIARGADTNAANAEGWTALHAAADRGSVEIVRTLLAGKAKVNARTSRFDETPLMLSCGQFGGGNGESLACTRLLIQRGADVNAQTKDGETPLMFASRRGLVDAVRLLLSRNAKANLKDTKGNTALSRVEDFTRIDADGQITYTQDSTSVPVYTLKVFEALVQHGKVRPGIYPSLDVERKVEADALKDFLTIARLLERSVLL